MEYDEDRELTRYIWDHYGRLMTEFEWRVGRAIIGRAKGGSVAVSEKGWNVESALGRDRGSQGRSGPRRGRGDIPSASSRSVAV
jgi:hypothetical protein